jgi:hypothetical protein
VRFTFEPFAGAVTDIAHLAGLGNETGVRAKDRR